MLTDFIHITNSNLSALCSSHDYSTAKQSLLIWSLQTTPAAQTCSAPSERGFCEARKQLCSPRRCSCSSVGSREEEGSSSWVKPTQQGHVFSLRFALCTSAAACFQCEQPLAAATGPAQQSYRASAFTIFTPPFSRKKRKIPPESHCAVQRTHTHMMLGLSAEFTACSPPTHSRSSDKLQSPAGLLLINTAAPHTRLYSQLIPIIIIILLLLY